MSRSLKKPLHVDEKLKKKIERLRSQIAELEKQGKDKEADKIFFNPIRVGCRDSTIFPEMVGFTIMIHNGKGFAKKLIIESMVNHKLGEFSPTRKMGIHGKAGTR